jgi:hypothetical protein
MAAERTGPGFDARPDRVLETFLPAPKNKPEKFCKPASPAAPRRSLI